MSPQCGWCESCGLRWKYTVGIYDRHIELCGSIGGISQDIVGITIFFIQCREQRVTSRYKVIPHDAQYDHLMICVVYFLCLALVSVVGMSLRLARRWHRKLESNLVICHSLCSFFGLHLRNHKSSQ